MAGPRNTRVPRLPAGEMIHALRLKRDLLVGEVADALDVAPSHLSDVAAGRVPFSTELAVKIADFFLLSGSDRKAFFEAVDRNRPSFLIQPQRPKAREFTGLIARHADNLPDDYYEKQIRQLEEEGYCNAKSEIGPHRVKELAIFGTCFDTLTKLERKQLADFEVPPRSVGEIARIARHFRNKLGFASENRTTLVRVAELILPKILSPYVFEVFKTRPNEWQPSATAQVCDVGEEKPVHILRVREDCYEAARRNEPRAAWVMAHEIGHLALNHKFRRGPLTADTVSRLRTLEPFRRSEWQANEFAAALLMPAEECVKLAPFEISARFNVPIEIADIRMKMLARRRSSAALASFGGRAVA
jgi:transcriptional regulator with XRE-family HTH domain